MGTDGRVPVAGCVVKERISADSGVVAGAIVEKRMKTDGCIFAAGLVVEERTATYCRVAVADCQAEERIRTLRCVSVGIPSVGCWDNRSGYGRKPEAEKRQCDEKWWSCFELNQ